MESSNVDQIRQCCGNKKVFIVRYDGGPTPDFAVVVCQEHWDNDPDFRKFVKSKKELAELDGGEK